MNLAKLGILPAMQEEEFKFCRIVRINVQLAENKWQCGDQEILLILRSLT
jgi:hypothetical protein